MISSIYKFDVFLRDEFVLPCLRANASTSHIRQWTSGKIIEIRKKSEFGVPGVAFRHTVIFITNAKEDSGLQAGDEFRRAEEARIVL
jgi:hypothetical protein